MDGVQSRHCFSFGDHYDPDNTHHGVLLACNVETVSAGRGFDTHPHRATEIVTWVLEGALVHQDSEGNNGVVYPGLAQRMSAGTGVLHSERNDPVEQRAHAAGPDGVRTRFVQMWLMPDDPRAAPSYEHHDVSAELASGSLVPVASGDPHRDAAIRIGTSKATLHVAALKPGGSVVLPDAPFGHVYLAAGSADIDGPAAMSEGDSLRTTGDARAVRAGSDGAHILFWEMHSRLGG